MSADDLCSSLVPWFRNRPDDVLNEIARQSNIERADMRRPNIVQDATLRRPVRQAAQRLIRWSTALPEEVFQIGFQPRVFPDTDEFPGGAFNLRSYVGQNIDSIFVSTTQPYINDAGDTYSWRRRAGGNIWHRYEYEIYAYGGIDVNRALGDHLNSRQHEIAFAGGILPAMIRSAREYTGGPVIRIWINTNFDNTLNPPGENPPLAELPDERCTPRDAEIHYIPGPDNAAPPPHQPHGHDEHKRRRRSADNDDLMFPGANGGGVQDPLYNITPVPLSAVACVRDPTNSNRAYFFCANRYSVININPGTTYDTIAWGPKSIADSWPSLWQAGFSGGVDAVLPNPRNNKEMYFFCKTRYALINIALGTTSDWIVNGPKDITSEWPSLNEAGFSRIDAVLPNPANSDEAYFFSGSQYALINFQPGTNNDYIVNGPKPILDNWPSLKKAGFKKVDAILPNPSNYKEAYFFSGNQYALINVQPGSTGDYIINGPKPIGREWPSLRQSGFW